MIVSSTVHMEDAGRRAAATRGGNDSRIASPLSRCSRQPDTARAPTPRGDAVHATAPHAARASRGCGGRLSLRRFCERTATLIVVKDVTTRRSDFIL